MSNADTIEEFQKSFVESFFGLQIGEKRYPAKIISIARDTVHCQYFANKQGAKLSHVVNWISGRDTIIRDYPDLGCVKIGPTVGYVTVRPYRQFKKGYVPSNAQIYVPNQGQIRKVFPRFLASTNNKEVIWHLYNPEYWHPEEAVRLMDEGEGVGYPLSRNFGLYCHADATNLILLNKNRDVGVHKDGKFELFANSAMLKEQFVREMSELHKGKVEIAVCR